MRRPPPRHGSERLLVTVGEVTATTAVLWARTETGAAIVAELTALKSAKSVRAGLRTSAERDHTAKAVVGGLEPATHYRYQCRRLGSGYPIFRAMARRRPDFFLFRGDTVYADHRCAGPDVVPGTDFKARSLSDFSSKTPPQPRRSGGAGILP